MSIRQGIHPGDSISCMCCLGAFNLATDISVARDPIFLDCLWLKDALVDASTTAFADDVAKHVELSRTVSRNCSARLGACTCVRTSLVNWSSSTDTK